jgi:hypothetical protein
MTIFTVAFQALDATPHTVVVVGGKSERVRETRGGFNEKGHSQDVYKVNGQRMIARGHFSP